MRATDDVFTACGGTSLILPQIHELLSVWRAFMKWLKIDLIHMIKSYHLRLPCLLQAPPLPLPPPWTPYSFILAMYVTEHYQNQISWFLEWVKRDKYREKSQNQQNSRFHWFFRYQNYAASFNQNEFNFTRIYMKFVLINDKSLQYFSKEFGNSFMTITFKPCGSLSLLCIY